MKEFFKSKLINPIIDLLKQGITPEKIALSIAFGLTLGVFPMLGTTVLLCALATYIFKLNIIAIQVVNYMVYPLQLILFIPFIRVGETIFQAEHFPLSMEKIFMMLKEDMFLTMKTLWVTNMYGVFAWTLTTPIVISIVYFSLTPILKRIQIKKNSIEETK